MKLANLAGRAVLVHPSTGSGTGEAIDIAGASDGRFGPDPQALFDDWDAFAEWASTVTDAAAAASVALDV